MEAFISFVNAWIFFRFLFRFVFEFRWWNLYIRYFQRIRAITKSVFSASSLSPWRLIWILFRLNFFNDFSIRILESHFFLYWVCSWSISWRIVIINTRYYTFSFLFWRVNLRRFCHNIWRSWSYTFSPSNLKLNILFF